MMLVISLMRLELSFTWEMCCVASATIWLPFFAASMARCAAVVAVLVLSAVWRTDDANSSMLEAVSSSVDACSSVRADKSVLPALIWRAALAISTAFLATDEMMS